MKKILVYLPEEITGKALRNSIDAVFDPEKIVFSMDLKTMLRTNEYGLVIDATTLGKKQGEKGLVEGRLESLVLESRPDVVCVYDPLTVLADIRNIAVKYYGGEK